MESVCFAPFLLALLLSISDTTAFYPLMKAVRTEVVVKEGSNVTLTCRGWNVISHDTTVLWKFNGHEIQGNANKDEKFQDDKTTGTFSLSIKNVSRKGVGTYTCLAKVADIGKTYDDEDYVRLSLDKKDTIYPVMKAVYTEVVVKKGSDVTLTCHGWNVERQETRIIWKFNGHEIQGNTNKEENVTFLDDKKGTFYLHIRKVSAKDVGNYTCLAKVSAGIGKTDDDEDYVRLSLGREDTIMKSDYTEVEVKEGSNTFLTCRGHNVERQETRIIWKFDGHEIQGDTNKEEVVKFLDDKKGTFYLFIYNVSAKDVGIYTCLAKVSAGRSKTDDDEDYVKLSLYKKDTTAIYPVMKADRTEVAVNEGSNVTLTCRGWNVMNYDTTVLWKFNGHEIQGNTTKKEFRKFQNRKRGIFSLYIQNVSRKDVGIYTCLAMVSGPKLKTDDDEDYVKLSLAEKGLVSNSTTGATSSHLQTSTPTRSQTTQYVIMDLKTILLIVLGLLVGLTSMTLLIFYRRRCKPPASLRSPPDLDENDFKYDVFVTYSRKDFFWVDRELLRLLRENQVKYCVDHKDFELGKAVVDNITDSVYQSRKVLAVWSGSYASSKYCKQELDYAIQRSFQNSDCSVIVITVDKTDRKQLPKPLRAKTFLDYSDSVERQGWEKRLIRHLKAPNYKKNSKTTIV